MALAYDSSAQGTSGINSSWTHTPVGTPRGVAVFLHRKGNTTSDDTVTVTYGGVSVPRVTKAADTTDENMGCVGFYLGESIPTGAQTVQVTNNSGNSDYLGISIAITAATTTTELAGDGSGIVQVHTQSPSVTISNIYGASYGFAGIASGYSPASNVTAGTGQTIRQSAALSTSSALAESSTSPNASGDITIAFTTSGTEDVAMVALAVQETSTRYINVSDNPSVSESKTIQPANALSKSDSTAIGEAVSLGIISVFGFSVNDGTSMSESLSMVGFDVAYTIGINEPVTIDDTLNMDANWHNQTKNSSIWSNLARELT